MNTEQRILVIGLDGATFDVLLPLIERGFMPHLARYMEKGAWGSLDSTIPPFTAAAWSTFATGQNPGQHGIISFQERDSYNYDTYGSGFADSRKLGRTLWEIVGDKGKRVAVINVPLSYPPRPVNGYMVTGMLTPPGAEDLTFPKELRTALGDDYIIDLDFLRDEDQFRSHGFPSKAKILSRIREMTKARGAFCLRILEEEKWDLFVAVFTGTDRLSHFLWDELDNLIQNAGLPAGNLQADILRYLSELDELVHQIREAFGEDTFSIILSDHGFGPSPTKRFYPNIWLEGLGLLRSRDRASMLDLEYWRIRAGRNELLKRWARRIVPEKTQEKISGATVSLSSDIIDWSRTKAYWVPIYFQVCGIEINLSGQRREGIVSLGSEYEALRDNIIAQAGKIMDPSTGETVVERAVRREEIYSGGQINKLPDIILILKPEYLTGGSLAGNSPIEHAAPIRPGEHRQNGIFAAGGPSITSCHKLSGLALLDVPPTILYSLGLPVPSNFDGRVMTELFDPNFVRTHPVTMVEVEDSVQEASSTEQQLSEEEEEQLLQRLRGMGYID